MKLTLYPNDYGIINQDFFLQLNQGINQVTIDNIPLNIDPYSIIFSFENTEEICIKSFEYLDDNENKTKSLFLNIEVITSKTYELQLSYKINKISYNVFYNFLYDNNDTMSAYGWLEIINNAGVNLQNVDLQIIIYENGNNIKFTLDDNYDIPQDKKINISFLFKNNIPVETEYIIPFDKNVMVECISIQNSEQYNLGTPLMSGVSSLYFKDEENTVQFIGSEKTEMYLPDESIMFEIGKADDLVQTRKYSDEENHHIIINNISDTIINVRVEIDTYGQEIENNNVIFTIDPDDNIAYIDLKIHPFVSMEIIYKLQGISTTSIL